MKNLNKINLFSVKKGLSREQRLETYKKAFLALGLKFVPEGKTNAQNGGRIELTFKKLKSRGQSALILFLTVGDPNIKITSKLLEVIPKAGVDIIELGFPFSDPMADGPIIQRASERSLKNKTNLKKVLLLVKKFRKHNQNTPIVLMGYYNPIYRYGRRKFIRDAKNSGVDGLIVVDLPPEADNELCLPAIQAGINFIRLATPTTDEKRLPVVLKNTNGFVYFVSISGITGTKSAKIESIKSHVRKIRAKTNLPIAVGFGVKTAKQVREIAKVSDGVVVGSSFVSLIERNLNKNGQAKSDLVKNCINFLQKLSKAAKEK